MKDKNLEEFDLPEEKDKLVRLKISAKKMMLGCGVRFECGNYINGQICTDESLCDDCSYNITLYEGKISSQESLILGIEFSKNSSIINKIKAILSSGMDLEKQIEDIKSLMH